MSLYSDLRDYLALDGTITALVETIRLSYAEQEDERPFIAVVPNTENRLAFSSASSGNKVSINLDINCHGHTFESVHEMKEAVRLRLDAYRGLLGSVFISQCKLINVSFDNPSPRQGQGNGEHLARVTFELIAEELPSEVR